MSVSSARVIGADVGGSPSLLSSKQQESFIQRRRQIYPYNFQLYGEVARTNIQFSLFNARAWVMEYTPDHAARAAKQKEIEALLAAFGEASRTLSPKHAKQLLDNFITITSPLDPPIVMEMMVMSRLGRGGTRSRKPGNIRLNWRQLFEAVPDVTLAGAGATEARWLIPFAALYIWMKLWKVATLEIEEKDAFVLYSLWLHRNERKRISEDEAFSKTQSLAQKHKMPKLTKQQFDEAINRLISLECIELDSGEIWLCEWIVVRY